MKKLLVLVLLAISTASFAGPYNHHGHWHHHGGPNPWVWIGPTIVGGVIGYEIARSQQPVIIQQPPVILQQPPVVVQNQSCSPWTEIQNPDGTITRTRTCTQ